MAGRQIFWIISNIGLSEWEANWCISIYYIHGVNLYVSFV